jgi:hypothetical protein
MMTELCTCPLLSQLMRYGRSKQTEQEPKIESEHAHFVSGSKSPTAIQDEETFSRSFFQGVSNMYG